MNTLAELFKAEAKTNVAVVIPDGGPRLTYQGFSAQIESLKDALLARGLTPGSHSPPQSDRTGRGGQGGIDIGVVK